MILLRKYNTKIESLKYLNTPTDKINSSAYIKCRVNTNTNICQSAPYRMEISFAYKTISYQTVKLCLQVEKDLLD